MSVEFADDRAAFIADFGVDITWAGSATPFLGIFERPSIMVEGLAEVTMIDRDASLLCLEAGLPGGAGEGDAVTIAGESQAYRCQTLRPDGTGFVVVDLKRA